MSRNNPNKNFATYEADREAKRKAQSVGGGEQQHTPGPWTVGEDTYIGSKLRAAIAKAEGRQTQPDPLSRDDARQSASDVLYQA